MLLIKASTDAHHRILDPYRRHPERFSYIGYVRPETLELPRKLADHHPTVIVDSAAKS